MSPQPDLDPVSVLITLFTALLGPQLAPVASVYLIIFIGAFVGLMIALRRRDPTSRLGALGYSFVTVCTAMVMTVWVSQLVRPYLNQSGTANGDWLFFPVAMTITAYGEVWMEQSRGLLALVSKIFQRGA
jgi:disulfide bond formation protein DsbB